MASEIVMWKTERFQYEAGHGCYSDCVRELMQDCLMRASPVGPVRDVGEGLCDESLTEYPSMARNGCNTHTCFCRVRVC